MIGFYIGWVVSLLITLAWCVAALFLVFHAGAAWGHRKPKVDWTDEDQGNWKWLLAIGVVLELSLVLIERYT